MSAKCDLRSGLLLVSVASLSACAGHTYGVSVDPAGGTWQAEQYLTSQGFRRGTLQKGDVLVMERGHGDSLDAVRILTGGPSPAFTGFYSPGSGFAVGGAGAIPVSAAASVGGSYIPGSPAGSSGKLTIEIVTYRIDRDGHRHAIEPGPTLFSQADSVITLVSGVPSAKRH